MSPQDSRLEDPSLFVGKNYIDGQWLDSVSGERFEVYDPATGVLIGSCPESVAEDAQNAIKAAQNAAKTWRSRTGRERARIIKGWHDLVLENKEDLGTLITWENGKTKAEGAGEVLFAASFLEWFSEEAPRIYGDIISHSASGFRVSTLKEPIGVCGLITPWNFPAAMITRKLGPALAAGCTTVVKTAGETPFTANALFVLAERAGIPAGVINSITAFQNTPAIGQVFCSSDVVRKISFTGSTRVGKLLMEQCSGTLKKLSLELGGNAPFIVFDDADLKVAVLAALTAKFKSSGQTCVCSNRIFVQRGIYDKFLDAFKAAVTQFRCGPGFQTTTTHGPLISTQAVQRLDSVVQEAVRSGAKIEVGGQKLVALGSNYYAPTILSNVTSKMRVMDEELFGPVAPVLAFDTEEQAIEMANAIDVGLASYIFTQDLNRADRVMEQLEFGMVAINSGVVSDAAAPFGGVKWSGIGREGSKYGIEDYLSIKTVMRSSL